MTFVEDYQNLLIKQYWDKPKASAEIGLQAQTWQKVFDWLNSFITEFDIDQATGDRLDIIGKIVGVPRIVPAVIAKLFFGFDDNINSTTFADKFVEVGGLAPFYDKFENPYDDYELTDGDYKQFIKAKINKNVARLTMVNDNFLSLQEAVNELFEGLAYITDGYDMSITLYVDPSINEETLRIIDSLDLIPRPMGVKLDVVEWNIGETFGFASNPNSAGFQDRFNPVTEPGGKFADRIV